MPANQASAPKGHAGARNFFFYFLTFALLYTVAISLGGVLFNIINKALPQVGQLYYGDQFSGALRYHISALIIGTPIFLWLSHKVYKGAKTDEVMRLSGVRRWLTYITLILAALIVIGDLIALVNNLLGGETTIRFILKALVVLAIAGSIFYYYLTDVKQLRQETTAPSGLPRIYFITTIIAVLASIVAGFFFIESPLKQRQRNQDQVRLNNLQEIDNAIFNQLSVTNGRLPASLSELTLREGVSEDPITKQPYRYEVVSATTYKLCASFETSNIEKSASDTSYAYGGPDWLHDAGDYCFTRTTDAWLSSRNYPVKPIPSPILPN